MIIGVTGASGQLGRLVVEQLKRKEATENFIALVRTPEKLKGLAVASRPFDYDRPENMAISLDGIDHLLLISGSEIGQRARQHANVIKEAKRAGVKWIVYTSLLHADTSSLSLAREHFETEKALKNSGVAYTILRNGWYTENYAGSIAGAIGAGSIVGSAGSGKISSATRADFAEAAAVVISDEANKGKIFELAGDEAYTLSDLAAEVSKHTGKVIPYTNLPEEEYAKILKNIGLPDFYAKAIASWDTAASKGDLFDDSKALSQLLGRPTTPMRDVVKVVLQNTEK